MAANSIVSGRIVSKFKLIQAFVHVLVSYKSEEDQITKMKVLVCQQHFPHCKSDDYSWRSRAAYSQVRAGQRTSGLIRAFMVVLNTCKNEEDPI